ncbi:AAA family ATPase [Cohaesibacter marisflavi]|uniref:AAA family ATPase n=1 Tax=Cohaesibacter marisflavi TaxID=655353 RepID=UPI00158760D7|nr:AAA family ATPase [Cohaesibacter marisflavi]
MSSKFFSATELAGDFIPDLNPPTIVKGIFSPGEISLIAGAPGTGKTSIMSALCSHTVNGLTIGSLIVEKTPVFYFAPEDPAGVKRRAYSYMGRPGWKNGTFFVISGVPDLTNQDCIKEMESIIRTKMLEFGYSKCFCVIDTLTLSLGDGDENSASTASVVAANLSTLAKNVNGAIAMLHHVSGSDLMKPRGSSGYIGNMDCVYVIHEDKTHIGSEKVVLFTALKQKNTKLKAPLAFKLGSYEIGIDKYGDVVTVPQATIMDTVPSLGTKPANDNVRIPADKRGRKTNILQILGDGEEQNPGQYLSYDEIMSRTGAPFNQVRNNRDSLRKAVSRIMNELIDEGRAEHDGVTGYRIRSLFTQTSPES